MSLRSSFTAGIAAAGILLGSSAASAGILVTAEAPGVQNTTAGFSAIGVETFEGRALGTQSFTTSFGGSSFSGSYANVQIDTANQFGSAGGTGLHAVTFTGSGYTLDLSTSLPGGVNYFGFWLSALDGQNQLKFFKGGTLVFEFDATRARDFINALPNRNDYFGNPTPGFSGRNSGEPYAFLNFYGLDGTTFDRIQFFQNPVSGGYESDNHTVGQWERPTGTPLAVPEPASWAMLIAGFGLVGAASRRQRRPIVAA
jgi:hypothetical protein